MTERVSIVLLNWNSAPLIYDAAASAVAQQGIAADLVIVDNGSQDDSLQQLKRTHPDATFIELGHNTGFAAGMNAGIAAVRTEFALLQNADLLLAPDHCATALAALRADAGLGAVGGLVQRLEGGERTAKLDECGYLLARSFKVSFVDPVAGRDVMGIPGCSACVRMDALRDVARIAGYVFDPWYFTYFEDIDLMLRLNLAGWRVRYLPDVRSWHVRSASIGGPMRFHRRPVAAMRTNLRNRVATFIKSCPRNQLWRLLPPAAAWHAAVPPYLLATRPSALGVVGSAWRDVWRERRRLLADRRRIMAAATPESLARFAQLIR